MKTRLKWTLIGTGTTVVLAGAWAGATKLGYIPNWLDIEILCPGYEEVIDENVDDNVDDSLIAIEKNDEYDGEINDIPRWNERGDANVVYKPIIYLYPEEQKEISVKLGNPKYLSHTYPKYNSENGWSVIAKPNGDLEDIDTGRKLYALYWEGISKNRANFNEGFVVKGEDIISFLEEKLALLGLNDREAEEFIIYWLPELEGNKYNLIRFATQEEINEGMPLDVIPKPDTIIRVLMQYKALDSEEYIPEQKIITPERQGFTVVEWGGQKEDGVK